MKRRFENWKTGEIHSFMDRVLGPPKNQAEVSRRVVAFVAIDVGLRISGLTAAEERKVKEAMEKAEPHV